MKKVLSVILVVLLLAAIPVVANAYSMPAEIADAGVAAETGVWPMAAGQYDPELDGKGIKDGTYVYGFYDFDFATFAITPWDNVPDAIAGYTKVDSPADMTDGTFCVLTISGAATYSYVLVLGEPGAAGGASTGAASSGASAGGSTVPKTADNTGLYTFLFVMLGAAAVLSLVVVLGKKKSAN